MIWTGELLLGETSGAPHTEAVNRGQNSPWHFPARIIVDMRTSQQARKDGQLIARAKGLFGDDVFNRAQ